MIDGDFNKLGKKYAFAAFASERKGFGALPRNAEAFYLNIEREIGRRSKNASQETRDFLGNLFGCLSKLDSFLLPAARIIEHVKRLKDFKTLFSNHPVKPDPDSYLVYNYNELYHDFDTLILQTVAGLDRLSVLTKSCCKDCVLYRPNGKEIQIYFSNLEEHLQKSQCSDVRAEYLYRAVNECKDSFLNVIISDGQRKTLRNQLAHQSSIPELSGHSIVIHWLKDGRVLRFDHELYGLPMVATARQLMGAVPYLILKAVGLFLGRSAEGAILADWACEIDRSVTKPEWENPLIFYKDFIDLSSSGPRFTVSKCDAGGSSLETRHLREQVLDFAEDY